MWVRFEERGRFQFTHFHGTDSLAASLVHHENGLHSPPPSMYFLLVFRTPCCSMAILVSNSRNHTLSLKGIKTRSASSVIENKLGWFCSCEKKSPSCTWADIVNQLQGGLLVHIFFHLYRFLGLMIHPPPDQMPPDQHAASKSAIQPWKQVVWLKVKSDRLTVST